MTPPRSQGSKNYLYIWDRDRSTFTPMHTTTCLFRPHPTFQQILRTK